MLLWPACAGRRLRSCMTPTKECHKSSSQSPFRNLSGNVSQARRTCCARYTCLCFTGAQHYMVPSKDSQYPTTCTVMSTEKKFNIPIRQPYSSFTAPTLHILAKWQHCTVELALHPTGLISDCCPCLTALLMGTANALAWGGKGSIHCHGGQH